MAQQFHDHVAMIRTVRLSQSVEFDDIYIKTGHKGNPRAVASAGCHALERRGGERSTNTNRAHIRHDTAWKGCGHPRAG